VLAYYLDRSSPILEVKGHQGQKMRLALRSPTRRAYEWYALTASGCCCVAVGRAHSWRYDIYFLSSSSSSPSLYFLLLDHITRTMYVDAIYCYQPSSIVCWSVCRCVCHTSEPCENDCTDRDAVSVEDSCWPREACIRWGSRFPCAKGRF